MPLHEERRKKKLFPMKSIRVPMPMYFVLNYGYSFSFDYVIEIK